MYVRIKRVSVKQNLTVNIHPIKHKKKPDRSKGRESHRKRPNGLIIIRMETEQTFETAKKQVDFNSKESASDIIRVFLQTRDCSIRF